MEIKAPDRSVRGRTLATITGALALAAAGAAQTPMPMRDMHEVVDLPADCRSVIAPEMRGTVQPWQAYVWLEHCDRIKRLQRLSALLPPDQQPRFYEGTVPASRLPPAFGADVPVLRVVFPERTFFDTDLTMLRPEAQQVTAIIAESLRREPPDVSLFIAGHADERGERDHNEGLSIDRAEALAQAIFRAGVSASSIWRIGFGEDMPLVSGASPSAWDRNRRVEFLFAARPEAVATWLADQQLDGLCQARDTAEVARCKERLDFRRSYQAVEVGQPMSQAVQPSVAPPRAVASPRPSGHKVAPTAAASRRIDPRDTAMVRVAPKGMRSFDINPRARKIDRYNAGFF